MTNDPARTGHPSHWWLTVQVDAGQCSWCEKPYDRTVCFEGCVHASPTCAEHFDEYFNDTEWMPADYLDPMCPDCFG